MFDRNIMLTPVIPVTFLPLLPGKPSIQCPKDGKYSESYFSGRHTVLENEQTAN